MERRPINGGGCFFSLPPSLFTAFADPILSRPFTVHDGLDQNLPLSRLQWTSNLRLEFTEERSYWHPAMAI